MSTPSPTSPPKRPRLSLQIKAIANGATGRTSRNLAAAVDVKSPTSFNTLSNVYATAVDRSTPVHDKPPQTVLGGRPSLKLQTQESSVPKERRMQTPYLGPYLDTPVTAQPMSPAISKQVYFPSAMTATPPMSAAPPEQEASRVFTFETQPTPISAPSRQIPQSTTTQPRRSRTMPTNPMTLPYTHPRSLRSILRNSPLPPLSTQSPESPRRQSLRLQEKAARRVAYNSPLCQTITTSKYTRSHVDLLADDATPTTPSTSSADGEDLLDQTMAYTGNETRDGGQTPGPFEEMRRRMAGLRASTPTALSPTSSGGIRKRGGKKKEKKRRWVWTIGQEGEDADELGSPMVELDRLPAAAPKKEVSITVLPVASVPVIALPLPKKPRTRMQTAMTASALQIHTVAPAVSIPVPPPVQNLAPEPIPLARITPEPVMIHPVEPPTPSVESVASTSQDSVFEPNTGDVEMSDASSMFSDCDQYCISEAEVAPLTATKLDMSMGMGMDVDMDVDMATPTTAIRIFASFGGGGEEIRGLMGFAATTSEMIGVEQ